MLYEGQTERISDDVSKACDLCQVVVVVVSRQVVHCLVHMCRLLRFRPHACSWEHGPSHMSSRERDPAAAPHPNCPNFDFKPCPPSLPSVLELQVVAGLMNGNLRASFATRMSAINVQCRREACMTSPPRPRHYCNAASSKFRSPA